MAPGARASRSNYSTARTSPAGSLRERTGKFTVLDGYGQPPNVHGNGALYNRIAPSINARKPAGEWRTYDVTLIGCYITVVLNGAKVIDSQMIEGLTAIARDPNEAEPGPLALQGDHKPVDFRNIAVKPLLH